MDKWSPKIWSLWTNGPQPIWSPYFLNPTACLLGQTEYSKDHLSRGTKIFRDYFSMGIKSQLFFKNAFGNHCKREDQDVLKRWLMALIGDLLEWSYVPYDQSSLLTEYLFCQTFFEILVFTNTFGNHCISKDQEALKRWLIALIGDLLSWSKKKAFQVASNLQLSKELRQLMRKKNLL